MYVFSQGLVDSDDEYFNDGLDEAPEKDDIIAACPFLSEEEKKVDWTRFQNCTNYLWCNVTESQIFMT